MIDPKLTEWATVRQLEYIDAINREGGIRKAARALGVDHSTMIRSMAVLKRRAALQGYSPDHDMTRTVPDGFTFKGVSTYYDSDGKPRSQSVMSRLLA